MLVGASTWHRFKTNRRFLKIKSVEIGDSGIFVCKGVNGFGSVSVQIQLVVRGTYLFISLPYNIPKSFNEISKNDRIYILYIYKSKKK